MSERLSSVSQSSYKKLGSRKRHVPESQRFLHSELSKSSLRLTLAQWEKLSGLLRGLAESCRPKQENHHSQPEAILFSHSFQTWLQTLGPYKIGGKGVCTLPHWKFHQFCYLETPASIWKGDSIWNPCCGAIYSCHMVALKQINSNRKFLVLQRNMAQYIHFPSILIKQIRSNKLLSHQC